MQDSLAAPTYSFTTPVPTSRARQRPAAAPGCALCTILVKLEAAQSVDPEEQTVTYSSTDDQPLSPAMPSPAVAQNPLLPANPMRSSGDSTTNDGRVLVVDDNDITGWLASPSERLANDGRHAVIVFKRHVEDVYAFGPADIPLLVHALQTAHAILDRAPSSSRSGGKGKGKATTEQEDERDDHRFDGCGEGSRRIGFLTGFPRDPQFPYAHLHIHATLGPHDAASWYRRSVAHNAWSPGWWNLEDLIAEIRETTSNNRVKSGYASRRNAPLANAPAVGSRPGLPNALEPRERSGPPAQDTTPNQPTSTSATDASAARLRIPTSKHDDVPTALLDAVIRDAERKFWVAEAAPERPFTAKDKQKGVDRAPVDGPVESEGIRRESAFTGTSTEAAGSAQVRDDSGSDNGLDRVPL